MADSDAAARSLILKKLRDSREEVRQLLDPSPEAEADGGGAAQHSEFPRSHTMRALLSGKGLGTIGALAGGLLIARPGLVLRVLRLVPAGTVAKMLLSRLINSAKAQPRAK